MPLDVHARIRAYGSLAAEVADAGVPGVVAMRYNVYVVTAAQFAADLYAHLLAGRSLGEAATAARRALADNPVRQIGAGRSRCRTGPSRWCTRPPHSPCYGPKPSKRPLIRLSACRQQRPARRKRRAAAAAGCGVLRPG